MAADTGADSGAETKGVVMRLLEGIPVALDVPWIQFFYLVAMVVPVMALLVVLAAALQWRGIARALPTIALIVVSLTLIGAVSGYSGGLSRVGVVGNLVPAILGLLGGVVVYLFGVDTSRGAIASIAATALVSGFFLGYAHGAEVRKVHDVRADLRQLCLAMLGDGGVMGTDAGLAAFTPYQVACERAYGIGVAQ